MAFGPVVGPTRPGPQGAAAVERKWSHVWLSQGAKVQSLEELALQRIIDVDVVFLIILAKKKHIHREKNRTWDRTRGNVSSQQTNENYFYFPLWETK